MIGVVKRFFKKLYTNFVYKFDALNFAFTCNITQFWLNKQSNILNSGFYDKVIDDGVIFVIAFFGEPAAAWCIGVLFVPFGFSQEPVEVSSMVRIEEAENTFVLSVFIFCFISVKHDCFNQAPLK